MACHFLCTGINFDAGSDSRIDDGLNEWSAILLLLADRLIVEDRATDALAETGRGHNHLPVSAPGLRGLGNPKCGKSSVAGGIAFVYRQQPLVAGDQRLGGIY